MHVLLTNDDGIDAPGLELLESVAREFGTVTVVAPDRGYSGCGHQVTNHEELKLDECGDRRYRLSGTPADCTRIGLSEILPDADWVIAGVNWGANLGVDLWMSGTVAAIREATWMGRSGIALSQYVKSGRPVPWSARGAMVERLLRNLFARTLSPGSFWNVNFPDVDQTTSDISIVDAQPEAQHLEIRYTHDVDGVYRYAGNYRERPRTPGSDVDVCLGGSISVSQVSSLT